MNRSLFTSSLLAALARRPVAFRTELAAARSHARTLTVRHLGALVTTRTTFTMKQLAALAPLATTHDRARIAKAFAAIESAALQPASEAREQRWHLTFADAAGATLLVVTSSVFKPEDGTIAGRPVRFGNAAFAEFLRDAFAPGEPV